MGPMIPPNFAERVNVDLDVFARVATFLEKTMPTQLGGTPIDDDSYQAGIGDAGLEARSRRSGCPSI
ncbi:hypothetical protein GFL88_29695 [Rhizobium leguminosarum bv. viciae]|uniref:hypothetical protein n=1 Tax=Rhizobium leguminosarum TaxID=384 RepID=UPI00144154B8|nr:hypothetical protein [Rhizobium leguminosarum]NKK67606.1 hypothetical protein [Rhizobium leguminosarum bv. viciae]